MYSKMFEFKTTHFYWVSKKYLVKNVKKTKENININLDE